MDQEKKLLIRISKAVIGLVSMVLLLIFLGGASFWAIQSGAYADWQAKHQPPPPPPPPAIVDGVDTESGLIAEGEYMLVKNTCTACHSGKLVTQNRATAEGWTNMIRWMQETQDLWDLGANEAVIVNYLATYYAPEAQGRRAPLKIDEWYELEN